MVRLFIFLFLVDVALLATALIDCLSVEEDGIRGLPRAGWVAVILLFSPIGPVAWFLAGRPVRTPAQPSPVVERQSRDQHSKQRAPDDDPEFLRSLRQQNQDDAELLRMWEEDLRRREEELRRREEHNDEG